MGESLNPLEHFGIKSKFIRGDTSSYNKYSKTYNQEFPTCQSGNCKNDSQYQWKDDKYYCPNCLNKVTKKKAGFYWDVRKDINIDKLSKNEFSGYRDMVRKCKSCGREVMVPQTVKEMRAPFTCNKCGGK